MAVDRRRRVVVGKGRAERWDNGNSSWLLEETEIGLVIFLGLLFIGVLLNVAFEREKDKSYLN